MFWIEVSKKLFHIILKTEALVISMHLQMRGSEENRQWEDARS